MMRYSLAIARMPFDERRKSFEQSILGESRPYRLDEGGRIVLDEEQRGFAGIVDRARFVGVGERFQLWRPDTHDGRRADWRRGANEGGGLGPLVAAPAEGGGG